MTTDELTKTLKGRTINGTSNSGDAMTVHFSDSSELTLKTKGSSNAASTGGTVESVEQTADTLTLVMDGGAKLAISLAADPEISVRG